MAEQLPTCAVVVVSFASATLLEANLARVSAENPTLSIYVVDNFSTDAERARATALGAERGWEVLTPSRNLGFGAGCNLAADTALREGAEQVLLLNPDAYLDHAAVQLLRSACAADPMTMVAPVVLTVDGGVWSAGVDLMLDTGWMRGWSRRPQLEDVRSLPWLSGACLCLSRELWERVGGFDPDYFLYWEDVDLSCRVQRAGGAVRLLQDAFAVHDEGATHRRGSGRAKSPLYYYYNVRNRMLFARKHLAKDDASTWLRTSVREGYQVLLRGGRRQLLAPHRSVWPIARGVVDGARWRIPASDLSQSRLQHESSQEGSE